MATTTEASQPELAILFIGVSLVLGLCCRHLLKGTRVPYTVALLLLGIALGASEYGTSGTLGTLGESIRMWSNINPSLILFVFLPALLFDSSFSMEVHQIKRCLVQMVLLAGPGVVISTFCSGILIHYIIPYNWTWSTSLLLGGLLSATDPVAVVALLKELGASKKLNTLIEGESLMNDGTAIVIFRLFFQMVLGQTFNAADIIKFLSRVALGGVALGLALGLVSVLWLGVIFNDTVIEITLTLAASYIAYYTAEDEAGVSGVLTVMTVGIFFAVFARTAFKGETQQSMHYFWEIVAYIANTLIFILSGVVIAESILRSHNRIEGQDWGYLVLLYIFLQLSRAIVVFTLYPGLRYFGYGLTWKEATILIWAGLRGAVALSLSLSVNGTQTSDNILSEKTKARFVFLTGGVVFLTLIINGSTTQFLISFLGMRTTSETKARILEYTKYEMNMKALEAFGELGDDEELGPAEWQTITKYITCLNTPDEQPTHPHEICDHASESQKNHLQDTRLRLLHGIQASYWTMLEEGRITQTAAMILMQSIDEALDSVMRGDVLLDWNGLQPHVQFPCYLKNLHLRNSKFVPKKLLNFLVVERLELGCYISAAFLRAHRIARCHLREFIGESEIAEIVIRESEAEEASARNFLEDIRLTFPEVLCIVKTKQVTYAILNHLLEYIQGLENAGLLEEKETSHLHDSVQADLKKLLRNPPSVKMPLAADILSSQPFLGALPDDIQGPLKIAAKESIKLRDSVLYREDTKADGVFLVANGVVKWRNIIFTEKHLLHPTFSHGSTLGLYEVLTGKPWLCDLSADSVVHCFFIEATHILSASRSSHETEEFFWKESSLAVVKILLPERFEGVTMQELRVLVMDGSTMRTYLWGEVIDILQGQVGILLEGFLKQVGKNEIIAAPAALTFLDVEHHMSRSGSLSHQSASYHAETRSRILVMDLPKLHPELHRASTSFLSSKMALASRSSFERGLMHWPDTWHPSELWMGNSFLRVSARSLEPLPFQSRMSNNAMQLGFFGQKVRGLGGNLMVSSAGRITWLPRKHNQSYPISSYGKRSMSASVIAQPQTERRIIVQHVGSIAKPAIKQKTESADSSDASDGDEEHIVRIDSPSSLFHHPLSH